MLKKKLFFFGSKMLKFRWKKKFVFLVKKVEISFKKNQNFFLIKKIKISLKIFFFCGKKIWNIVENKKKNLV